MSLKRIVIGLASMAALAFGSPATAEVVSFQFTGTVSYGAPMAVLVGTPITGRFSYDTKTSPGISYKGYVDYQLLPPFTISGAVGGHTITTGQMNVAISRNTKSNVEDAIVLQGSAMVLDGTTFPNGGFGFVLASNPGQREAVLTNKLPSSYDLDAFGAQKYGYLRIDGSQTGTLLQFSIDSVVPVPYAP